MLTRFADPPSPRGWVLAVSVVAHLAALAVALSVPQRRAPPSAVEVAFAPLPIPQRVGHNPLHTVGSPAPRRKPSRLRSQASARRARAAPRPAPAAVKESSGEPRPLPMASLTIRATAEAPAHGRASSSGGYDSFAGTAVPARGAGPPGGDVLDGAQATEPPAVLTRAELRDFYPRGALQKGFQGDVKLRLVVAEDGSLREVEVLRDPGEGLGAAGARAIRSFRFRAARVHGAPVATAITFVLHFVLG